MRRMALQFRILLIGSSLLAAVGCFGSGGEGGDPSDGQGTGGSSEASDENARGSGGAHSSSGGTESTGGGESDEGGDGSGGSTPEEHDEEEDDQDPFCPHAWNGFEQLDIFLEETNAIGLDPDMDGTTLNAHGKAAREAGEDFGEHFERAQQFVVGTEVSEAFDGMLLYQRLYMVPHAQLAETSSDVESYQEASFYLLLEDGVAEAVAAGTIASGTISAYTLERCGNNRWP